MPGKRNDPLTGFNFFVSFVESGEAPGASASVAGGFSEVSGLDGTLTVEEYAEGGENRFVHKFPTRMTWSNLVFKRGIGVDTRLWAWHFDYVNGRGRRRDGLITLADDQRRPMKVWKFRRGFPLKWTGPTLNAQQSGVAIESIEVVHEGLELIP